MDSHIVVWHLIALAITSIALCCHTSTTDENWQLTPLLQPSQANLLDEQKGRTLVHDGSKGKALNTVLDWRVNRTDAVMSSGVVVMTAQPSS